MSHTASDTAPRSNAICAWCQAPLFIMGTGTYALRSTPDGGLYFCNESEAQEWEAAQAPAAEDSDEE